MLAKEPNVKKSFNADIFIRFLWPYKEVFPLWNIGVKSLYEKELRELFKVFVDSGSVNEELLENLSSHFMLGWLVNEERLKELFTSMPTVEEINSGKKFLESNIYCEAWFSANQFNYYQQYLSTIEDKNKTKWLAQAIANIVHHNSPEFLTYFKSEIKLGDSFNNELANCLAITCDFVQLLTAIESQELKQYVSGAINKLIINRRIFRLTIDKAINNYDLIKFVNDDALEVLDFLSDWKHSYSFSISKLETINQTFLIDVLNSKKDNTWKHGFLQLLDNGGDADVIWWTEQIKKPIYSTKLLVNDWFVKNNKTFIKCASL